jgi:hypothetical protein
MTGEPLSYGMGDGGNDTRLVPCFRSAHNRNALAQRAQLDHYGCHSQGGEASEPGRIGKERPGALPLVERAR